ncbi:NAD(P)H-dependent oxidoreductase [Sulfitobacter aestuarii]|uniref:NAD(P)H-dependent oxidoreductase n=1 Tax=Sulfitobacter aestuarii TaxID=2161676 RepID=A0ABW5U6E4_9RHOB
MKVLVVLAHPRGTATLCGAIAESYADGAREAGCRVKLAALDSMDFDPHVRRSSPAAQEPERDLVRLRQAISAADHLVFVYPTWWGTYPALLKGFLDRILTPGWAFEEITGGTGFAGLLGGRSAELITTMDTPGPVYRFMNRAPGANAMARATLGFCGIDVTRHTRFGPVNRSTSGERAKWIESAARLGRSLARGTHSPRQRFWRRASPWLAALRLQFYPMTFFAYWMGALIGSGQDPLDLPRFWLGYLFLFALEAATVFGNDLEDFESDRRNALWGPFNGGSRVLHNGLLDRGSLRKGMLAMIAAAVATAALLMAGAQAPVILTLFIVLSFLLTLGYTQPPLKLSYRTLGEIDVAVTHSFMSIAFGHLVQGGMLSDPRPWLAAMPLCLSILPAIILSGVPDRDADRAAGKRTVVVAFGIRSGILLAAGAALAATGGMIMVEGRQSPGLYGGMLIVTLAGLHGGWLFLRLLREATALPKARRLDGTMVMALSYILWFCIPPLWTIGDWVP